MHSLVASALLVRDRMRRIDKEYRLEPRDWLDMAYDKLCFSARCGRTMSLRNRAYLAWRYLDHPLHRYEMLALYRQRNLCGYAFVRREDADLWVDDWLVASANDGVALGHKLIQWARADFGVATVQARVSSVDGATVPFRDLGFMSRPDSQSVFVAGAWSPKAVPAAAWFFTAGDKDV